MSIYLNKTSVALTLFIACQSAAATISMQSDMKMSRPQHQNQLINMCSYTNYLGRWVGLLTGNDGKPDGIVITRSSLVFDSGELIPHSVLSASTPIVFKPQLDNIAAPTVYLLHAEQCNSNHMCLIEHLGSTTSATDNEPTAMRCYTRPKNAELR